MAITNMILVSGNIGGDVALRFTPSGAEVVDFSLAHTPRVLNRQNNQWEDGETQWFKVVAWNHLAKKLAATLSKGMPVVVRGKAGVEAWADKRDGSPCARVKITADDVWMIPRNPDAQPGAPAQSQPRSQAAAAWDSVPTEQPPF